MTSPDADHERVAGIVARLTKGQREAIAAAARAYGLEGWEVRGRSANSLTLKRLAYAHEFRTFSCRNGRRGFALTPLGLLVKAHITKGADHE